MLFGFIQENKSYEENKALRYKRGRKIKIVLKETTIKNKYLVQVIAKGTRPPDNLAPQQHTKWKH